MLNELKNLQEEIKSKLKEISSLKELNELKIVYLGKKGPIQLMSGKLGSLSIEEKQEIGSFLNNLKREINEFFEHKKEELETISLNERLKEEKIDITLPSTKIQIGTVHPLNSIIEEIEELFISMGYDIVEGPEIESDLYNFERLNLPKDHPARDMQDSFYITEDYLLRTQTSPVQARTMESNFKKEPIRIICPGKVYRKDDDDATHSHQFTQIEGLVIDKDISIANLKGTLEIFVKQLFGEEREIRFRPSYFPFTEPSLEVDVTCFKCSSKGCSLCKETGWIEILGAGMVHPSVLKMSGYDPEVYSGFAFGLGPDRIAMLKYGITDIRYLYTNHIDFLNTFNRMKRGE